MFPPYDSLGYIDSSATRFKSVFPTYDWLPVRDWVKFDHYWLPHPHSPETSIGVPGTDVCIAGDQLRTKKHFIISDRITDYSKCDRWTDGDADFEDCPKSAHTTITTFDDYLVGPLTYDEHVCLQYDDSKCNIFSDGDADFIDCPKSYAVYQKGVWADDTVFDYDCVKWTTRLYRHPLQFRV